MERLYTMKEAKKLLGVTTRTIQKWDKEGKIKCIRTVGGRRRIPESEIKRILGLRDERIVVGYCRVSTQSQRDDLERQRECILNFLKNEGYEKYKIITDIGSGLSEKRRGFNELLNLVLSNKVDKVIIAYPDRLVRFGFKILEKIFEEHGTKVLIVNKRAKTPREELVDDLISIISHFTGKLYGMRSHKYKKVMEDVRKAISS